LFASQDFFTPVVILTRNNRWIRRHDRPSQLRDPGQLMSIEAPVGDFTERASGSVRESCWPFPVRPAWPVNERFTRPNGHSKRIMRELDHILSMQP
jgi:hypothetical protein